MRTTISPGQLAAMDSCFGLLGLISMASHTLAVGEQFCCSQPSLPHVWHVKLPLKGVLNTSAWYISYAMLMRPKRLKQLSMAANWPGEMVVRMRDVLAHRVGVSVCHLAFIAIFQNYTCKAFKAGLSVKKKVQTLDTTVEPISPFLRRTIKARSFLQHLSKTSPQIA